MKVSAEQIVPSQGYLKPQTVQFILECIRKGQVDQLPPAPIVRRGSNGELIAIDGHNLIAVRLQRKEDLEVHIADTEEDGLPPTTEANIQRNLDLKNKFESVLTERLRLREEGIDSFQDLVNRYADLFQG